MIQYAGMFDVFTGAGEYWIPAFAGKTVAFFSGATCSHKGTGMSRARVAGRGHTRIGIST
jgi:hypothetical protein